MPLTSAYELWLIGEGTESSLMGVVLFYRTV
jgi:hypothetical protein